MISLSKKLIAPSIKSPTLISTTANFSDEKLPFIPFSHLQKIKQLESQLISTLEDCKSLAQIKQTHAYIIRKCIHQSSYLIAKLVRTLSKINVPTRPYGVTVFSQVSYPNAFLYTALIRGYLIDGMLKESVLVYNSMRRDGLKPLSFTFAELLKKSASESNADLGRQLHGESVKLGGFDADLFVVNTVIYMYVKCGLLDCGRKVFEEMPERDLISWTTLIDAYAKAGETGCASQLFRSMPAKDTVAWTAMVTGFVQNAKPREALEYFERMQNSGVQTDQVTLIGVINACAQLGAVRYAKWIRNVAESSGFSPAYDVQVGSALIDMYSKCGCLEEAHEIFKIMQHKNVYSYSSMILAFAVHSRARSAIELFEEMVKMNVKPNSVTFLGVLTACSHGGLLEEGKFFFERMAKSYNVSPSVDHYNCMVDLLGRRGKLEEALDLVKSMPMEPNAGVWGALLGASRLHANTNIAEIAAQRLFKLEPTNPGNCILLSDAYAKAGKWGEVQRVRKLVRAKGLRKPPAFSWVEGEKGVIHEFYAGNSNRETTEVLEDLRERVREYGYETQVSAVGYDVSDEEKRRILMHHSEKVALAYALLVSEDESVIIRIGKNLRICEDCHLFMCVASRVCGREIMVRDNLRFHHFRHGSCSCSNFW